jgi:hypothetical protein
MSVSLYRLLLRAYPATFRAEYEAEMVWAFERQLARTAGPLGRVRLLATVAVDLAISAAKERLARAEPAVQPVEGDVRMPIDRGTGRWHAGRDAQIAVVIPFAVTAVLYVVPGYFDRLFMSPPDIIGIPFGFVLQMVTLAWAALGAAVVWQTPFRFMAALALTVCTGPAVIVAVLTPMLIGVMQNLAV